ncbi:MULTISPECIES: acetyl-CoA carboxylase, carboxyltransferase subunit beta [Paenibacillus]|uniref:Acetyl-coenzyme A carboxylase carboxyl transferase subunit beta n=2 Tax=Paenibacillus TaxID=44249 RepID=A0ABU6DJE2_9BACL|nr:MULTISPECIES: acetyl-CoA carboxylase, carboxyltransferase subunit beta [Paenibacillus]MBA2944045.1 acetyl-CoA carboxylase carboxyltransferase subunit beta [Paenibacillus sp. CGMCC 1.16610]MCY9663049.1 acetyl-CoA carboxylase, carboxyltransferase subunit beta [Paenibacillus anseongense]MEB4797894.1 acetyl-CoA carboxylase, carboxyltransferase subunit beta [Paenibacillus chondroitinus]MVQ37934.1 acetyl-CoA carboxylase carboxyltransferase subunit beta [Paenibacillus anseongense]
MLKDLFQKRKYATIPSEKTKREIPEGLMNKCPKCGTIQTSKELEKNLKVCTACGYHYRLSALERIQLTLDEGQILEYDADMISEDPLQFPDYVEKLDKAKSTTKLQDAIITGEGTIGGYPVVIAAMSFDFMGGSLGSVVGERITRAVEAAIEKKVPIIIYSTSGGARMQESILSLMQMAKTSAALSKLSNEGGLFISVITDPTFGGVSASFAMLGDIIIAEPAAPFGFTGRRVIEQTIKQKLPDNFQTSEFNLEHGQLDKVVPRKDLRPTLIKLLDMHGVKGEATYGG